MKKTLYGWILICLYIQVYHIGLSESTTVNEVSCIHGDLMNSTCVCAPGWTGVKCDKCNGRRSLHGVEGNITDGAGNYSLSTKCSWLIDANVTGKIVWFNFDVFATECGWDHLYIHDGDSSFTPVLASFSGLMLSGMNSGKKDMGFSVNMTSRYLYVHFSSDAAYTMTGFNITYRLTDCHLGCSNHGTCINGVCQCYQGYDGDGCEKVVCPNNCSMIGECINKACVCDGTGFKGDDCSLPDYEAAWMVEATSTIPLGRASHVALVDGDTMWVVGGYILSGSNDRNINRYDFTRRRWRGTAEQGAYIPRSRYGHASDISNEKLYMYGGVTQQQVLNDLWVYNTVTTNWTELSPSHYNVSGHTAHVVNNTLYVFFGYSPKYGYLSLIQEYNIDTDKWEIAQTYGATVQGGYGHTSVLDIKRGVIYVYGGYHSDKHSNTSYNLTDKLYMYDIATKTWVLLKSSGSPRYLHSAVMLNGLILIYGGNTHNDTSVSLGAKCHSTDFLAYDIECNNWHSLAKPSLPEGSARYGQSMVNYNSEGYMYGGFNGLMLKDLLKYTPGNCSLMNQTECESILPGTKCVWYKGMCSERSKVDANYVETCDATKGAEDACEKIKTCSNCEFNAYECNWCSNRCSSKNCSVAMTGNCSKFSDASGNMCKLQDNCHACNKLDVCVWANTCKKSLINTVDNDEKQNTTPTTVAAVTEKEKPEVKTEGKIAEQNMETGAKCKEECSKFTSCENCTAQTCMWCSNMKQCVGTNSYVVSFPYGQCTDWTTKQASCPATRCSGLKSCKECQDNSMCGWCNDPSNTGLGRCIEGGATGPVDDTRATNNSYCPADRWYFTECPVCQCNGHSTCIENTSKCESCQDLTEGPNCQYCETGYFGNPENGGNCSVCECYDQADLCDRKSGVCHCRTRGVTGEKCDECDKNHSYVGDPKSGGTCYYQLVTDYQFTFNLSKPEDRFFTQINFMNIPASSDRDVDFTLNCSGTSFINITYKSKSSPDEQLVIAGHPCEYFKSKFEHKDYNFGGDENTTFLVYVYGYTTPFWLIISFSQFPKIDLVHFFITFFSCFLSLLLIAAVLWKIKHKYDGYRRRQQLIVEMQQMASRPFATVTMEIYNKHKEKIIDALSGDRRDPKESMDTHTRKRKKCGPGAIAIEPLHNNKAAILSLIIQLPNGDEEYVPDGLTGVAVASTIVTLGNTRKQSVEHIKGDKSKLRKQLHHSHPETCA